MSEENYMYIMYNECGSDRDLSIESVTDSRSEKQTSNTILTSMTLS